MKKKYILAVLAVFVQGLFGAAGSSSPVESSSSSSSPSSSIARSIQSDIPYLELLYHPGVVLDNTNYFKGKDYEKKDLLRQVFHEAIKYSSRTRNLLNNLISSIINSEMTVEEIVKLLEMHPLAQGDSIAHTIDLVRIFVEAPTMQASIRHLVAQALAHRLRPTNSEIAQAFFSPLRETMQSTKIEETILWLIRSEQKSIKVAVYMLNNHAIMQELSDAMMRGVRVDIIVNKDDSGRLPESFGLPYKRRGSKDSRALMHNKFLLFDSNMNGTSILVTGSYNLTFNANTSFENIVVLNNKKLFKDFLRQFNFIEKYAHPVGFYRQWPSSSSSSSDDGDQDLANIEVADMRLKHAKKDLPEDVERYQKGLQAATKLFEALKVRENALISRSEHYRQRAAHRDVNDQVGFDSSSKRPRRN